jgi:hypothetical protein
MLDSLFRDAGKRRRRICNHYVLFPFIKGAWRRLQRCDPISADKPGADLSSE